MEILLLFGLAGGLAWIWNRMETLERRVVELEGASLTGYTRPDRYKELPSLRDFTPSPRQFETEPAELEAVVPPPASTAEYAIPEVAEEMPEAEQSFATQGYRFRHGFDFEEIFGRLLPIWGGGIALAIAGFFLVRWSIAQGMLPQSVRVAMGLASEPRWWEQPS